MIDAVVNSIIQMFAPPLRAVLWKSIGLALALIVVVGIALDRLIVWLLGAGGTTLETTLGAAGAWPGDGAGLVVVDCRRPRHRRRQRHADAGGDRRGRQLLRRRDRRRGRARELSGRSAGQGAAADGSRCWEGVKTALFAVLIYLVAVPFMLWPVSAR